jgi:hypothetical protein
MTFLANGQSADRLPGTLPAALRGLVVLVCAALSLLTHGAPRASACDYTTMRDAAFDEPRDVHRLYVIGEAGDAAARQIRDQLAAWRSSSAPDLNVEVKTIDADDPQVSWMEVGIPSAPPMLPVTVLTGRRTFEKQSFFIDHWEPGPRQAELAVIGDSPARQAITREVGRRVAVLLYMPGTDPAAGRAKGIIDAAIKAWTAKWPAGLSMVQVERSDPRERVLRSFTGVPESGPDWLAVVFGRGKLMLPLVGPEITEQQLNEQLEVVVQECTCLRSPSSLGADLPLVWTPAMDKEVIRLKDPSASTQATTRPTSSGLAAPAVGVVVVRRSVLVLGLLVVGVVGVIVALAWRRRRESGY